MKIFLDANFYYIMTERKKYDKQKTIEAIDLLSKNIEPIYITHIDFLNAKKDFFNNIFSDFEDLIILNSALRVKCDKFITNDKLLKNLKMFYDLKVESPK